MTARQPKRPATPRVVYDPGLCIKENGEPSGKQPMRREIPMNPRVRVILAP